MRPPLLVAATAAGALALDASTKSYAAAFLDDRVIPVLGGRLLLRESRNPGAAFSIGTDHTVLITLLALVVVAAIAVHARSVTDRAYAIGLGLVAGGAAGNLVDRLLRSPGPFRGQVVDWIDLGWFPSFNLADTAITIGAGLLLIATFRADRAPQPADPTTSTRAEPLS